MAPSTPDITILTVPDVFLRHFGHKNADGDYEISPSTLSVMTSMINVGELLGSLSAAPLNDFIGRKGVFLTGTVTIIIGVILQLATSSNKALITAGRAILGFGVGNFSATSPLYMGVSKTHFVKYILQSANKGLGNRPRVNA